MQLRAAAAYKINGFQGMDSREMMSAVLKKSMTHLYTVRDAVAAGNFELVAEQSGKIIHIYDVLYQDLLGSDAQNDAEAAPAAKYLLYTYRTLIERVANLLSAKDVLAEIEAIMATIKPLYEAWQPPKEPTGTAANDSVAPL